MFTEKKWRIIIDVMYYTDVCGDELDELSGPVEQRG